MKGFELFNGDTEMRIVDGARTVFTTEGVLINLLPDEDQISLSFNVVMPNFTLDFLYNWQHRFDYNSTAGLVGQDSACSSAVTAPPQEYSVETDLADAPIGADIFVGHILLNRTTAPTHTWNAATINPLQPMNVQIPFVSGSLLLEAQVGMARAMSIYVVPNSNPSLPGKLKLHRQQSVSTPPGGWGVYGTSYEPFPPSSGSGGENVFGSQAGIPIHVLNTVNVGSKTYDYLDGPPYDQETRYGVGPYQCSVDTSGFNYSSTYSTQLVGSFGRRS